MERLVEVVQRRARERAQRFVGRTLDVLVEGPSRTDPIAAARTHAHNKVVNFAGSAQPGEFVPVRITSATSQTLAGEASLVGAPRRAEPASTPACSKRRPSDDRPTSPVVPVRSPCEHVFVCGGTTS